MRALDFLLTMPDIPVNPRAALLTGLSMGGEIATIVAARDPRFAGCIPAGFSPDLDALFYRPALNHTCWRWMHVDLRDYIDTSDLHSLIAPCPLIVQTGKQDHTYSSFSPPFASDKQVARRSRAAYGNAPEMFVHNLHLDGHRYHVADVDPSNPHA
jgi:pimeloyl-ACP methyl ester carboxylesterase